MKREQTIDKCRSGMSDEDIQKVLELLDLKKELHIICKSKIKSLKMDKTIASNKLLGIKYNFQNRKMTMEKT
jgi:hypothetical protein